MDRTTIKSEVESLKDQMVEVLSSLVAYKAAPLHMGGTREFAKAEYIVKLLDEKGLTHISWYNSKDPRVPSGYRPNFVLTVNGKTDKKMWIISHLDDVSDRDFSYWHSDPFQLTQKGSKVYAAGVNDNGQAIVASLFGVFALNDLGIIPKYEVNLCFVSDRHTGSQHGIQYLVSRGLFSADDLILVPESGNVMGDFISLEEKDVLWLEFVVVGHSYHASTPEQGVNACRVANVLSLRLDDAFHKAFPEKNKSFIPPFSTMEPTKRKPNVEGVDIISGRETFYFDCRILPSVETEEVLKVAHAVCRKVSHEYGIEIECRVLKHDHHSYSTPDGSEIVTLLKDSIRDVLGFEPRIGGIGKGTCAAFLRRACIPVAVWAQKGDTSHKPNEYVIVEHIVNEAKVFALLMSGI